MHSTTESLAATQPTVPAAEKVDGRSREARAARQVAKLARADAPPNLASRLQNTQERQYEAALESADVKAAIFKHEGAQARRDSISRKLCGGSTAVTVNDLARWEASLSDANKVLAQLARHKPILERQSWFINLHSLIAQSGPLQLPSFLQGRGLLFISQFKQGKQNHEIL